MSGAPDPQPTRASVVFAWLAALLVGLASWWYHRSYADHGLALFDVGILFDGALRTLEGQVFGAEFTSPYGPLRSWVLAALFALLEPRYLVFVETACLLLALGGALVAYESARRGRWVLAVLVGVVLALGHGSLHKVDFQFGQVLAFLGLRAAFERPSRGRAVIAGALLCATFLLRYDLGGFAAVALVAALGWQGPWRTRGRTFLVVTLTGLTLLALVLLFLLAAGLPLDRWWSDTWQRIAVQERIRADFPWPLQDGRLALRGSGFLLLFLLLAPTLILVSLLGATWRRLRGRPLPDDGLRIGLALLAIGVLNQARLIPSANHLFQAFPALVLVAADLAARSRRTWVGTAGFAAAAALLFVWIDRRDFGAYPSTHRTAKTDNVVWDEPHLGMALPADELSALAAAVRDVRALTAEDQPLAFGPACALFCFLAGRPPAHDYAEPSYYYRNDENQRRLVDQILHSDAECFLHLDRPTATFVFEQEAPRFADFVRRNFRLHARHGDVLVFRRQR